VEKEDEADSRKKPARIGSPGAWAGRSPKPMSGNEARGWRSVNVDQTSCSRPYRRAEGGSSLDAWQPANPGGSGADVRASESAQWIGAMPSAGQSWFYTVTMLIVDKVDGSLVSEAQTKAKR
jgi:hypothetical protein